MQLVGKACIHCQQRIPSEIDGHFCSHCGSAVHNECARQARAATIGRGCSVCGAPRVVLEGQAQAAEEEQKRAEASDQLASLVMILLGILVFIGGLAVTILSFAISGGGFVCIATGAMFTGLGLVGAGLRRMIGR